MPPSSTTALADLLRARAIAPEQRLALRVSLNPHDRGEEFHATADLVKQGAALTYARMQDGLRLGAEARVLVFAAEAQGRARLIGHCHMRARRRGVAPGDIVYDYDFAHLLHSFIARARHPTFYDAFEEPGLEDLTTHLLVQWPRPMMRAIRRADDAGLTVVSTGSDQICNFCK